MVWKKKTSLKERLCFEACGALKKAQDQDLASTLVKRAFFSIEITSVFGALEFPAFSYSVLAFLPFLPSFPPSFLPSFLPST